ncbi:hypothetical protein C5C03_03955 [Clavibacter michiganensis]|uniref:nuclear transport factor 2 family protein n=1 Tax=Clavibacter michiganensis TaxID=28447 RepID=UPI000CE8E640|nr:nuclear transport factor 2 family protein [Clavibacter michiganensis]PPF89252.1 hypothetical protein C5C03_03955 [Clavibacter michiganensis]PPF97292.1 hypothetical protein C5C05_05340 [Clavibacter michiganensis]
MSLASVPAAVAAVELYFQALHESDLDKFDRVFHPAASLFDVTDGALTAMPVGEYREVIRVRQSPASVGQPRDDTMISLDFLSPDMAVSKVRLRIHEHTFVDHLTLAKVDGAFRIVAKTWHEV